MDTLITDLDMLKLADCLERRRRWPGEDREHIEGLRRKVNTARVVRSDDIPADVITLHSRVRVMDLDDASDATYTLVMGAQESTAATPISVMSPIGIALLSRREGHEIGCWLESGLRRLRIEDVLYQPEAVARLSGRERIQEGGT
jgi:regulator of nucleoside diphosphate kinase